MVGYVEAKVRYLAARWRGDGRVPTISEWGSMVANTVEHEVRVHDARGMSCGVETTGFERVGYGAETDFRDPVAVEGEYLGAVADLVRRVTGADHVVATHHFIRWGDPGDFEAGYAGFLHGDKPLTDPLGYSWDRVARLGLALDRDRPWDFAWYNTWQPIDHPATRNPLALLDARTADPADTRLYSYDGAGEQNLETVPLHNPAHRFYYYPDLAPDELILFKQLETRPHRTPTCLHSAIEVPAPPGTPLRRSIEVRWMCVFRP
ncbi:CmcJ/NvfI family oxidoreductase [Actinokineospora terrae]|uniref:Methyltransferase n=1 Tax=Actinokineospora terrae TaxID=155974 RepID=A0A1H9MU82_9PSEU|nr:CmcJ/NvfI family oxidoreductase [Actinokineospora terrae]SER27232.1 hypothetical protein SAMN04487818_102337 [Actinokineospora terrae]